ncbi:MAG: 5-(carboxyamino)imidazole ribonucleotide synthase [Xanthomonadales bacterium]|nr:5-(carboxyamino)imidazole ribonucleotide synthase [Xanthomonadales bacterium]
MKIAFLGGGQLAMMMADAGQSLGDSFSFLDPNADSCAGKSGELLVADYSDPEALSQLAASADIASYEFENVAVDAVLQLQEKLPVYPSVDALKACQDRLEEKQLLQQLGIPLADFAAVNSRIELLAAIEKIGYPAVLKTRRMGYDGKGQMVLKVPEDLERAWHKLGDYPLILEAFVAFENECSMIAARAQSGDTVYYSMSWNIHLQGVLAVSFSPWYSASMQQQAEGLVKSILEHFDYVGVLTLELFNCGGHLVANEIAPRVHNSGHLTIEGSTCSQFENHIRAISGRVLGSPQSKQVSVMLNWLGEIPKHGKLLVMPGIHLHDYGKQARPGRKLGHTTVCAENWDDMRRKLNAFSHLKNPAIQAAIAALA